MVQGLHFLTRIGHRWIQLFWSVIVLSGFIGLGVHLYNIIGAYLEYKMMEYSYERDDGYDFPDITMCNLNGISPTNLRSVASQYEHVQYYLNMSTSGNEENAPPRTCSGLWVIIQWKWVKRCQILLSDVNSRISSAT